MAVKGQTTVLGTATFQGPAVDSLQLDQGALFLKGHTDLYSTLQFLRFLGAQNGGRGIVNDVGAVFEAHDHSGIVPATNISSGNFENRGTFRIRGGLEPFHCVVINNVLNPSPNDPGLVEVGARTVIVSNVNGERLRLDGAVVNGTFFGSPGDLQGNGYIGRAEIYGGRVSGQLRSDSIALGDVTNVFEIKGRTAGSFDHFFANGILNLDGAIDIRLGAGFVPRPPDVFTILTASDQVSGRFSGANFSHIDFGIRVPVTDGAGSFLLERALDRKSVVLRDFSAPPRNLTSVRWIGAVDGDWNNPANWNIHRVPNDTSTEAFDVSWEAHPVTIRVIGDISRSTPFFGVAAER